jgi:hypothetical protein
MIEALLGDAEQREIEDDSVKRWLYELKYLAADAEDTLEEYEYHLEQKEEASSMVSHQDQVGDLNLIITSSMI